MANFDKSKLPPETHGIIIAEESKAIRHHLNNYLASYGFEVIATVDNGVSAVKRYAEKHPSVILVDINLPVLNGLEVTQLVMQIDPEANVIIMSAEADRGSILQAMHIGAINFVAKPVKIHRLLAILTELMGTEQGAPFSAPA